MSNSILQLPSSPRLRLLLLAVLVAASGCGKRAARAPAKPKFTVSRETTYLTGPLREDGSVDYIAGINERLGEGVTPENNAVVLLAQAIGPARAGVAWPAGFFQAIGAETPPPEGKYLLPLTEFARQQGLDVKQLEEQRAPLAQRIWRRSESPTIAQWLDANEAPLELVVAASERTRYFSPLLVRDATSQESAAMIGVVLPGVQAYRDAARMLCTRALLRAGEGDMPGARRDLLACQRLGRLVGLAATLTESLVGMGIEEMAHSTALAIIESAPPSAEDARKWLAQLDSLPPRSTIGEKMELGERCMYLDCVLLVASQRATLEDLEGIIPDWEHNSWLSERNLAALDWDVPLRTANSMYDRIVAANRLPTRAERQAAFQALEGESQASAARAQDKSRFGTRWDRDRDAAIAEAVSDVFLALFLPAIDKARTAEDRAAQQVDLLRAALALAAYRAEYGKYPALLQELTPDPLDHIPLDVFSDGVLHYRVQGDGYLLYSVGENQRDDGGLGADDEPLVGDDLAVRVPFMSAAPTLPAGEAPAP